MTIPLLPPVQGTPYGLGDLGRMAARTMEQTRSALSPDVGFGMHAHTSGASVTLSNDWPAQLKCFRICGCWKRHAQNVWGGNVKGCFWVCKAIPVIYWRQWKGLSGGEVVPPDSFWQQLPASEAPIPDEIFWVAPNSECCCTEPSSEAFTECPSTDNAPCQETDDWQAMVPPKYGVGNLVWCTYEYDSGVWRVLDAFDGLIQFKLKQPMKGCHTSARADLIGYKCKDEECSCSASGGPCDEPCSTEPSTWEGSCNQHVKARLRQVIRVYDPLGIVNTAFAKHCFKVDTKIITEAKDRIEAEMKQAIECKLDCMMKTAVKLQADRTVGEWHHLMGSCGPTMGMRNWQEIFCVQVKNFTGIALTLFTGHMATAMSKAITRTMALVLSKATHSVIHKNQEAPTGTQGWAKWNPENRHFEVIAYGVCHCNECHPSSCEQGGGGGGGGSGSSSSIEIGSSETTCDSSCEDESTSCVTLEGSEGSRYELPNPYSYVSVPKSISIDCANGTLNVEYCNLVLNCGRLSWDNTRCNTTDDDFCSCCSSDNQVPHAIGPTGELIISSTDVQEQEPNKKVVVIDLFKL